MIDQTPNWNNAPKWAQYWAVDPDGRSFWYEVEPFVTFDLFGDESDINGWFFDEDNEATAKMEPYGKVENVPDWTKTLQQRPTNALPENGPNIEKKIEDWALGVRCENNQPEYQTKEWLQGHGTVEIEKPTEYFKVTKGRNYLTGWPDTGF